MLEHNNKRQVSRPMIYGRNHNKNISIVNFSCVFVANDFLHSFYLACNVSCSLLASIRHEFEWHVLHRFILWLSGLTAGVHEGSHKDRKFKFRLGQVTGNTQKFSYGYSIVYQNNILLKILKSILMGENYSSVDQHHTNYKA